MKNNIKLKNKSIMFYLLLKDYTHHGGTIKKLKTIPKGTLLSKEPFRENVGLEYVTVGHGNQEGYYLSKEVVENNPEFFKKLTEHEFNKFIAIEKFKNDLWLANEHISIEEIYEIVNEAFIEMEEEPDPREEFVKKMEEIQKEMEKVVERNTLPFQPFHPLPNPYNAKCHCGNDGTQPCWSTACPKRIIITYGTGTGDPNPGNFWTVTSTIHNTNKKENNDR
jgi:hypothetical protein